MLTIAIDYDCTYTEKPEMWYSFIHDMCQRYRVQVICVTGRNPGHEIIGLDIPIVYVETGVFKKDAAEAAGYKVDIWIDDEPGYIERCRVLDWEGQ